MESINEFLSTIGFGKNEAEIYNALVHNGKSTVLEIAKITKLHRSNIYDALRNLVSKGLVYEIAKPTKRFYARPPDELINYLKELEEDLKEVLKNTSSKNSFKTSPDEIVKITQGRFAMREELFELLKNTDEINVYGIPQEAYRVFGSFLLQDFHRQRIKKKILMKHIYNSDSVSRAEILNKMKYTEAKILPIKYDSRVTTQISGNKVTLFLWDSDLTVVSIDDPVMANAYKNYFNILWRRARFTSQAAEVDTEEEEKPTTSFKSSQNIEQ